MKFYLATKKLVIKSKVILLLLFLCLSPVDGRGDVPIERDYLKLPDGRWIWLKKVDTHKTWVILGKGKKSTRNRIWSKSYESDGDRHTWDYAFFIRLKLDRFIDSDAHGNPIVAISTYDMANGIVRWAIVYRILKDRLEVIDQVEGFNVEADEAVYEKKIVPRDLLPHFKISDIQKWVGKYAFKPVEGASFFSVKSINHYLKDVLGKEKYEEFLSIEDIGPQTPIQLDDGIVHFTVCQKHNCGHVFYFLYEVKSKQMFVCEREVSFKTDHTSKVTWFSKKGKRAASHCEFYDEVAKEVNWNRTMDLIPDLMRQ